MGGDTVEDTHKDLGEELAALLNRYNQEQGSNTPDFLLSEYLMSCLATWNTIVVKRDSWHGFDPPIPYAREPQAYERKTPEPDASPSFFATKEWGHFFCPGNTVANVAVSEPSSMPTPSAPADPGEHAADGAGITREMHA
jgi:hypothetical protein